MDEKLTTLPVKVYNDVINNKDIIYKDNKNKSGVYKWTNKVNNKIYIGSSINLYNRFRNYLSFINITRIVKKEKSYIYSAIIKYGYSSFTLEILEYCDKLEVTQREQYYINNLVPEYNILKTARTRLGYILKLETKKAISEAIRNRKTTCTKDETGNTIKDELLVRYQGINVTVLDKRWKTYK